MDTTRIPQRIVDGDFAGWLRDAMNARSMSARMVGLRAGVNHSTITRLLYGAREPTFATMVALLRLFGDDGTDHRLTNSLAGGAEPPDSNNFR